MLGKIIEDFNDSPISISKSIIGSKIYEINSRLNIIEIVLEVSEDDSELFNNINIVYENTEKLIFKYPFNINKINNCKNLSFLYFWEHKYKNELSIIFKELYNTSLTKYDRERKLNKIYDKK